MENSVEKRCNYHRMKKFAFGFVVVLAGALLLAFNFELLPLAWKPIVSWQMLLIVLGIVSLIGREGRGPGSYLFLSGDFSWVRKCMTFTSPSSGYSGRSCSS